MKEYIQNIIFILGEAIENEDWELVSEAKNLLENEEFEDINEMVKEEAVCRQNKKNGKRIYGR